MNLFARIQILIVAHCNRRNYSRVFVIVCFCLTEQEGKGDEESDKNKTGVSIDPKW